MSEWASVISVGVEAVGKIIEYFRQRKSAQVMYFVGKTYPVVRELLFMHGCLHKAYAGLEIYHGLLSKTMEDVRQTLLVLGPHFKEMITEQLDLFSASLTKIPDDVGDVIKGNSCLERGRIEEKLSSFNNDLKIKLNAGLDISLGGWIDWLKVTRDYVHRHLKGVEHAIFYV